MKMNNIKFGILLIFILGIVVKTNAQHDSLKIYIQIASQHNPEVQQRYSEYQAALQKAPVASALQDPELTAGVFLSPMEQLSGEQIADIQLMQMFPWFGTRKAAREEMDLMAKAAYEKYRDAIIQLGFEVKKAWYELYKIDKAISVTKQNLAILRKIEQTALVRYQTGSLTYMNSARPSTMKDAGSSSSAGGMSSMGQSGESKMEAQPQSNMAPGSMSQSSESAGLAALLQIDLEIAELENEIEKLENQKKILVYQFNNLLNREAKSQVFITDSLGLDSLPVSLSAVYDTLNYSNPMISMLDYERQSLSAKKKMVEKMGYPMLGLGLNYSVIRKAPGSMSEMNGDDMIMPMVSLSLPIFRKKYKAMKAEAEWLQKAKIQELEAYTNNISKEYEEALLQFEQATRDLRLSKKQYLLTGKSFDISMKSLSTSGKGLNDVLQINRQQLIYTLKIEEAKVSYNLAVANLLRIIAQ